MVSVMKSETDSSVRVLLYRRVREAGMSMKLSRIEVFSSEISDDIDDVEAYALTPNSGGLP
jgi:hypothetical protein